VGTRSTPNVRAAKAGMRMGEIRRGKTGRGHNMNQLGILLGKKDVTRQSFSEQGPLFLRQFS